MPIIPERLAAACAGSPEHGDWLALLPATIRELEARWSLTLGPPFDGKEGSCAWVAPVVRRDGVRAVLKLGLPHMEATHEIQALRFWDGDPAVLLLEADADLNAMLLEACEPGTVLRELPEEEQDVVIAGLLKRLWRKPEAPHPFRPLSAMTLRWAVETNASSAVWPDAGLVREGLRLLEELPNTSSDPVLLATDLHAGNVLRAQRQPWLVIDPKPFVGDRAYDATQHLFNCPRRMLSDPDTTIRRFADLLEIDPQRVRRWMFARSAAEPRNIWTHDSLTLARRLVRGLNSSRNV